MAEENYKQTQCAKCKYHGLVNGRVARERIIICEYILYGNGRRGCSPEHCDKFELMTSETLEQKRRKGL